MSIINLIRDYLSDLEFTVSTSSNLASLSAYRYLETYSIKCNMYYRVSSQRHSYNMYARFKDPKLESILETHKNFVTLEDVIKITDAFILRCEIKDTLNIFSK